MRERERRGNQQGVTDIFKHSICAAFDIRATRVASVLCYCRGARVVGPPPLFPQIKIACTLLVKLPESEADFSVAQLLQQNFSRMGEPTERAREGTKSFIVLIFPATRRRRAAAVTRVTRDLDEGHAGGN